jgi:hypothetical protein
MHSDTRPFHRHTEETLIDHYFLQSNYSYGYVFWSPWHDPLTHVHLKGAVAHSNITFPCARELTPVDVLLGALAVLHVEVELTVVDSAVWVDAGADTVTHVILYMCIRKHVMALEKVLTSIHEKISDN